MSSKRFLVLCLCAGILVAAPAFAQQGIKVGLYGPLTGPMSLSGIASQQGAELAIKQVNAQGASSARSWFWSRMTTSRLRKRP